jgi:hypothetical protein
MTSSWLLEAPEVSSTGIEKNRDKEKIHESACLFGGVTFLLIPFGEKVGYAGNPADFKMLPTSMGRNEVVFVGAKVALLNNVSLLCELYFNILVYPAPTWINFRT